MTGSTQVRQTLRKIAAGGAWALAGRVGLGISGLAINALIARLLSPKDVGMYFVLVSVLAVTVVISQLGMQHAVVRLAAASLGANDPGHAVGVVGYVLAVGLGVALIVATGTGMAGDMLGTTFGHYAATGFTWLLGAWVVARTVESLVAECYRGLHDIQHATLYNSLFSNALVLILLGALALVGGATLERIVMLSAAATAMVAAIGYMTLRARLAALGRPKRPSPQAVWKVALPLLVTSVMLVVITQADLWVVATYLAADQVAVYGAAARLVQLVTIPMLIVNAVLPPFIAGLYQEGRLNELEHIIRSAATAGGVPTAAVLVLLALGAAPLLGWIYGPFYRDGATVLVLIGAGQLINGMVGASAVVLMMTGHQIAIMFISALCGVLLAVGGVVVVPSHGAVGVAAVTGFSVALHGVLCLIWVRYKTGMWTYCGGWGSIRQVCSALAAAR